MSRTLTVTLLALLASAGANQTAPGLVRVEHDAVPGLMNLQGYLTDAGGTPIEGARSFEFRIFRGTNVQWQEAQVCTVRAGLFSATLGRVNPIPDSIFRPGDERGLELAVEGQTFSPRVALTSAGFAFRAGRSDEAATVDRPLSPAIETHEIRDRAVAMGKIDQAGALPGEVIRWTGTNWAPGAAGGPPSGSAGGDLTGTYPNPQVAGLRGRTIATTTPSIGSVLHWYTSQWRPVTLGGDLGGRIDEATVEGLRGRTIATTTPSTGSVLHWFNSQWRPVTPGGDLDGRVDAATVTGLRGRTIATTTPSTGHVLHWHNSQWRPTGLGGDLSGRVDAATVTGLQGRAVSTNTPSTGQVLTWYNSRWTPRTPTMQDLLGTVRLVQGRARVTLDAEADLTGTDYYVFAQQTGGEPVPVVVRKHAGWFELIASADSDATFDYRVVAGGE